MGISPELSRNDNISDFLKLGEIVDTFDIGSLSVRPIYGWKPIARAIRLSRGVGSIYGRDPVDITLPLAGAHVSIPLCKQVRDLRNKPIVWDYVRMKRIVVN